MYRAYTVSVCVCVDCEVVRLRRNSDLLRVVASRSVAIIASWSSSWSWYWTTGRPLHLAKCIIITTGVTTALLVSCCWITSYYHRRSR